MMGSDHDGEVLNAARAAEKIRKDIDKSWAVLLSGSASSTTDHSQQAIAWMGRAIRAERQIGDLQTMVRGLQRQIMDLRGRAAAQENRAQQTTSRPRREPRQKITMTPDQEKHLVERLQKISVSRAWIRHYIGLPHGTRVSTPLQLLAMKYRCRMTRDGAFYRFHPYAAA
jgi:chromosome segregation ATPase